MPISTSVITGTVAHKHSATGGSSDGGKLATGGLGGDTSFDLASGSIMYSNGTSLDELVIGGTGTVLTESGGVPTWGAAPGGAALEYLESYTLGSSTSSFTWTFGSAITLADVAKVVVICNFQKSSTAATIFMKYNGHANADYNNAVNVVSVSGVGGYYNTNRIYGWDLFEVNNTYNVAGTFAIFKNVVSGKMHMTKELSGEGGSCYGSGYNTGTGAAMPTTLTSLYFEANTGNINSGSKFDLYVLNDS